MLKLVKKYEILNGLNNLFINELELVCVFGSEGDNAILTTKGQSVLSFGKNKHGCLGLGHENSKKNCQSIKELCELGIENFAFGKTCFNALTKQGDIYFWGKKNDIFKIYKPHLLCINNKKVKDICCGSKHSLALTFEGQIFSWGSNKRGQLGTGDFFSRQEPVLVFGLKSKRVVSISCGYSHTLALDENDCVYAWGNNKYGQLGIDSKSANESTIPTLIKVIDKNRKLIKFQKIACGAYHSMFLSTEGDIYLCGSNKHGQVGNKTDINQLSPTKLKIHHKFVDIAASIFCDISVALAQDQKYLIWGLYGSRKITPTFTHHQSFHEIYAELQITYKPINSRNISLEFQNDVKRSNDYELNIQNGTCEKYFEDFSFIASGGVGRVYRARKKIDQKIYAIKKIAFRYEEYDSISKEINILTNLNSEYVVKYYSEWIENNFIGGESKEGNDISPSSDHQVINPDKSLLLHIQMDFCHQNLREVLNQLDEELNQRKLNFFTPVGYYIASEIFIEILEGVNYLHKCQPPIIHRDLKPTNILITEGSNGRFIKIADFGLSTKHIKDNQSHTQLLGTMRYSAPEVLLGTKYDITADIYSIGVILNELFNINFDDIKEIQVSLQTKYTYVTQLMNVMMSALRNLRPDCEEILAKRENWALSLREIKEDNVLKKIKDQSKKTITLKEEFHTNFIQAKLKCSRII